MEDDAGDDAMARAMGFSGFGTQPSSKRRKYNPRLDDAVTDTYSLPVHRPGPTVNAGKGANALPLGQRSRNRDEILLEDDDEENEDAVIDVSARAGQGQVVTAGDKGVDDADEDDPEPEYIDTSRPSQHGESVLDQDQSQSIVVLGPPSTTLPPRPDVVVPPGAHSRGGHRGGRGGNHQSEVSGQVRSPWWSDYYDPTANMNPWEKLEKDNGLEPTNRWLTWEESKARWVGVKKDATQLSNVRA